MVAARAQATLGRIGRPVWRILLHSFIFGLALSIADILFNFYLVSLGYAADTAGLLSTVARGAGMLLGIPMGLLIDRLGSQRALLIGLVCYSVGWALILQAVALWALIGAQFVIGSAYLLVSTAITPLLASVTSDKERTTVFGLNAFATLIVGLLGSVVGGLLPTFAAGVIDAGAQSTAAYRLALTAVVGLGVIAMLPVLPRLPVVTDGRGEVRADGGAQLTIWALIRLALAGLLLGVGGGAFLPFQNLFFRTQFGFDDAAVGVALAWAALGMGMGALIGAPVTARLGLRRGAALLRVGAVPAMLLMLAPGIFPAVAGFFLRGLFVAASYPMNDALVMRATPHRQRGLAVSMMSLLWSGGWALASVTSGWVQLHFGFAPVIIFAAAAYLLSALAIFTLRVDG